MRKNLWKNWFFAVMLIAVVLTACSKEGEKTTETKKDSKNTNITESEYVYQPSFQNINTGMDYIAGVYRKEDRIYMLGIQWIEDKKNENGGTEKMYLVHCAMDGSDLQRMELKGKKNKNDYPSVFTVDDENQIHLLTNEYSYNEKTQQEKEKYYIYTINEKGKIIKNAELKLGKVSKDDYFYPTFTGTIFLDGKIYIASGNHIYSFDEDGKAGKAYRVNTDYIRALITSPDKKVYVYGNINVAYGLSEFDFKTEKISNSIEFKDYSIYDLKTIYFGAEDKIYLGDSNNLYSADLSTGEVKEELNWLNGDINGENIMDCFSLEEGKFLVINSSYNESAKGTTAEFVTLNKTKASDIKEKEIIKFACTYLNYDIKDQFLSFNKTNPNYRIEVKSYDAYEDPVEKMNMDITSGDLPDILDVSMGVSKEQMIKKGMLADLSSFMEKDSEIKKEDFIPSILKMIEDDGDGKIYYLSPFFSIRGFVSGKKTMGTTTEWSVDDMIKMYEDMPKDHVFMALFMESMTKQLFIQNILVSQLEDYVDFSTGEVKFNSEEFIKLMEFSNNFPDEEKIDYENQERMPTLVEKGKLLLNELGISSIAEIGIYTKLYKKQGGYTVLGYPAKEKSDRLSASFTGSAFAILEQSDKKEGAWEFLRQFYTYEYQKNPNGYIGIPTRQDAFEKKLEYAQTKKTYTDEDGTKVDPVSMTYGFDDYMVSIGPIDKEEAEIVRSLVGRIGICTSYDVVIEDISKIIEEEMKAFFAGDKSAKEAAEIIQSRVNIYISENS